MKINGIFLEFPLCCLAMNYDEKELLSHIISYCIVRHSDKIVTRTKERVYSYGRKFPEDFNPDSKTDCQIILAGEEFGVTIGTIQSNRPGQRRW